MLDELRSYARALLPIAFIAAVAWLIGIAAINVFHVPVACYYAGNTPPQPLTD